jgi:hypothetical protein
LRSNDWAGVATIMVESANKLADGGADFRLRRFTDEPSLIQLRASTA